MSITDFLLDRIAEDEAIARQASWSWSRPDRPNDPDPDHWETPIATPTEVAGPMRNVAGADTVAIATHIARHDPAHVLADCQAKRMLVELSVTWTAQAEGLDGYDATVVMRKTQAITGGTVLRQLAAAYRAHPDFDPAWSVDETMAG